LHQVVADGSDLDETTTCAIAATTTCLHQIVADGSDFDETTMCQIAATLTTTAAAAAAGGSEAKCGTQRKTRELRTNKP